MYLRRTGTVYLVVPEKYVWWVYPLAEAVIGRISLEYLVRRSS